MKTNNRGVEMALNTIIVLIILLILLVVLAAFFLGGAENTIGPLSGLAENTGSSLTDITG